MNAFDTIRSIDKGRAASELETALAEVAKAVMEFRLKGEISIKLTFKPSGDGMETTMKITPKAPKRELKPAIFFVDEEGKLSRDDPNQPELPAVARMESASQ